MRKVGYRGDHARHAPARARQQPGNRGVKRRRRILRAQQSLPALRRQYAVTVEPGEGLAAGPYVAETVPVSVAGEYVVVEA